MEFRVKKRDNCRINEVRKILKPVDFVPNRYGDRFIPRRYAQTSSSRFKAECKSDRNTDVMRMERKGYWKSHSFEAVFNSVFNLNPDTDKILNFRDATNQEICKKLEIRKPIEIYLEPTYKNVHKLDWGCKPRSKPLAFIESVHDLPRIKVEYTNIIDWSAKGQIAAIFSKKLVIWTPNTEVTIAYCALHTTAVAFNPTGEMLAMATFSLSRPVLRLLSCFQPNTKANISKMRIFSYLDSDISCLAWDCTGQYLACGLGNGQIVIVRLADFKHMNQDNENHMHRSRLVVLKFSHASKYLASSDETGHLYIWSWTNCQLSALTVWISSEDVALFDWHPWREEEIIIADTEPVTIALFHVPSRKVLSFHRRRNVDCVITALAFNKVSGELVVSYSYPGGKTPDMLVLASMDRVVDVMENHADVVAHLFWSPDGKQLASAGYDEALTIWNFFGTSPSNRKGKSQARSTSQQYLQEHNINKAVGGFDYSFLYKPIR
ncbi:protein cortex isoform X2 [Toxorhynchites rutilus septentrionalis]|uniref:protein cortex isoform X2 n=1 Tax=Toxorhynchites rutilus septentrionalis TaxID=329112 RepID=UPI00247B2C89|nr:protein cortex isoform X2 [Toxorhynchites rutilus septentrionalis]